MRFQVGSSRQAEELVDQLQSAEGMIERVPRSAIKALRGKESLRSLGSRTGIAAAQLSRIESGERNLSVEIAGRLAAAFGMSVGDLVMAHVVSVIKAAVEDNEMTPREVLEEIGDLSHSLPDGEAGEAIAAALLKVLSESLEREEARETSSQIYAATKAAKPESSRTGAGIRKDKPYRRID